MSDSIEQAVLRSTLIDVAVAFVLIVAAYWRPMRWPVLIGAMLVFPPLLCLRTSTGIVFFALFASMWFVVWKRVPGLITVSVAGLVVATVIPSNMEAHRNSLTHIETLRHSFPRSDLADRLRYEGRAAERKTEVSLAAAFVTSEDNGAESSLIEAPSVGISDDEPEMRLVANKSARAQILEQLHEGAYDHFVSSPGFGAGRMMYHWENNLWLSPEDNFPLPTPPPEPPTYPDELAEVASPAESTPEDSVPPIPLASAPAAAFVPKRETPSRWGVDLATDPLKGHREAKEAFLDPEAWGYVAERQTAYGFEPHAIRRDSDFTRSPNLAESADWRLTSLQLIGLLKHEQPMAYVSSKLPDMKALEGVPVRPLEPFETAALQRLRRGEELAMDTTSSSDQIRMLGAIRAGQSCLPCHSVSKGSLLGAFSYRLDRAATEPKGRASELR